MAQQTPFSKAQSLTLDTPKRLATTTITNEIKTAINQNRVLPKFGPAPSTLSAIQQPASQGQYQGMVNMMLTNNATGFGFPQFVPPLDE